MTLEKMHSKTAPGPRGRLLVGNMPHIQRRPLGFYTSLRSQYGDVVRFRTTGSFYAFLLSHPEDIEYVLRTNAKNYPKDAFVNARFRTFLGNGLLTSEGDFWLRQRRLAQPAFHRRRLAALAGVITDATEAMGERWRSSAESGLPLDVAEEMSLLTLQVVGRALLGAELGKEAEALGGPSKPPWTTSTSALRTCCPCRSVYRRYAIAALSGHVGNSTRPYTGL